MTLKEKVLQIRKELKAAGFTTKQVSVIGKNALYDESINIRIKDLEANKEKIQNIVMKYESIRYDEYNGEILNGCNTYVHVEIDYNLLLLARKDFIEKSNDILEKSKEECGHNELHTVYEDDKQIIFYQPHYSNGNPPTISLSEIKPLEYEGKIYNSYDTIKRNIATHSENIAEFLVLCKYQYNCNI